MVKQAILAVIIGLAVVIGGFFYFYDRSDRESGTAGSLNGEEAPPTSEDESPATTTVKIFLVALDDAGQTGAPIGCGDSVVSLPREIPATTTPLAAAYGLLLAIREREVGKPIRYNALYQSDLSLSSASISATGTARVYLSGSLKLGGVCDMPRVEAQLKETALQFSTASRVEIFVNREPLSKVLSLKGE